MNWGKAIHLNLITIYNPRLAQLHIYTDTAVTQCYFFAGGTSVGCLRGSMYVFPAAGAAVDAKHTYVHQDQLMYAYTPEYTIYIYMCVCAAVVAPQLATQSYCGSRGRTASSTVYNASCVIRTRHALYILCPCLAKLINCKPVHNATRPQTNSTHQTERILIYDELVKTNNHKIRHPRMNAA